MPLKGRTEPFIDNLIDVIVLSKQLNFVDTALNT